MSSAQHRIDRLSQVIHIGAKLLFQQHTLDSQFITEKDTSKSCSHQSFRFR